MRQLALDITDRPAPTLDNFIAGGNGELLQQLRRLALQDMENRFVYVWGTPGCGRSHLLKATVTAFAAGGRSAAYVACAQDKGLSANLAEMNCIALDDVDCLDEAGQGALFSLYNGVRESDGALIASGGVPPSELKLRRDLVTRLGWGLVYQVHPLTDAEKTKALRQYAELRGLKMSVGVCDFLLHRLRRDMTSLLVMLDGVDRYSLETKRPITVPLLREFLEAGQNKRRAETQNGLNQPRE